MHLTCLVSASAALLAASVQAAPAAPDAPAVIDPAPHSNLTERLVYPYLQINYYKNNACSSYLGQLYVDWATPIYDLSRTNCYNYQYGTSVNVAWAPANCQCTFYNDKNCGTDHGNTLSQYSARSGTSDCITASANLKSFRCFWT